MIKYALKQWNNNKDLLKDTLREMQSSKKLLIDYDELLKLVIRKILNVNSDYTWSDSITVIDDGDYQGALLFAIHLDTYQPSPEDYLLTFVYYGSCGGCDALMGAYGNTNKESQIQDYMAICKDLVCNIVVPFNYGWRKNPDFEHCEDLED